MALPASDEAQSGHAELDTQGASEGRQRYTERYREAHPRR